MDDRRHCLAVLAEYALDTSPRSLTEVSSASGFSGARLWRVDARARPLCLRRWPLEHPTLQRLEQIHAVLRHVDQRGFKAIPLPLATRRGATIVEQAGHFWELTPWLPGTADYHDQPTPKRLAAALTALARWHEAAATYPSFEPGHGVSPGILARRQQLQALICGGASQLQGALPSNGWPEMTALARRWLALLPAAAGDVDHLLADAACCPVRLQPCLRDIWHDHVLFSGDEVSGLIDFGALRQENVAADIARLLGSLVEDDAAGWQQGVAAYEAVRVLTPEERRLMSAFDASSTLLSPANWFRWVFLEERSFRDRSLIVDRVAGQLKRLTYWLQSRGLIWP